MYLALTPDLAQKIETDLEWQVLPVIQEFSFQKYDAKWFDFSTQKWKTPIILQDFA